MFVCAPPACLVLREQDAWDWSYRWLRPIMWVYEIKHRSSRWAASALSHWALSPALSLIIETGSCTLFISPVLWSEAWTTTPSFLRGFWGSNSGLHGLQDPGLYQLSYRSSPRPPFFFLTKQNHFIFKTSASSKFHLLILTLWSLCDATWSWFPSLTPDTDLPDLPQPPLSLSSGIPLSTFSLLPLGSFFPHLHIQIHPHSESRPAPISVPPVRSSLMTSVQINLYLVSKLWS